MAGETKLVTKLKPKQKKFINAVARGLSKEEAAKMVGYSTSNVSQTWNRIVRKESAISALEKAGLSDRVMAKTLKATIESGVGIKATNSDAISGLRLAYELKGVLQKEAPEQLTQNNTYINELKQLDDGALASKIEELTQAVEALK